MHIFKDPRVCLNYFNYSSLIPDYPQSKLIYQSPFVMIHVVYNYYLLYFSPFCCFIFLKFISLIYINHVIVIWYFDILIFTTEPYLFALINVYYILFIYTNSEINALFSFESLYFSF